MGLKVIGWWISGEAGWVKYVSTEKQEAFHISGMGCFSRWTYNFTLSTLFSTHTHTHRTIHIFFSQVINQQICDMAYNNPTEPHPTPLPHLANQRRALKYPRLQARSPYHKQIRLSPEPSPIQHVLLGIVVKRITLFTGVSFDLSYLILDTRRECVQVSDFFLLDG